MLAAEAKTAGSASEDMSHPKTTICDWETGLNPLKVGEDRVGDALDCLFEQSIEPLERWMRH